MLKEKLDKIGAEEEKEIDEQLIIDLSMPHDQEALVKLANLTSFSDFFGNLISSYEETNLNESSHFYLPTNLLKVGYDLSSTSVSLSM